MASDEPPELTELVGRELGGRYRLERVLGAGGMGAVFEASDRRLQRSVAVKVMQPGYARAAEYVERFLLEAQAASKIRHRNVVTMLDHGQLEGELVYSVMELLVGQDLEQFLLEQPGQRVGWARARDLLVQLASGLRAAHRQGVIHRDIKPANCVLTTEDDDELVVKVVDFGIAKLSEGPQAQQLTGTGNVLGTASYTAPERVLSHAPATPRSDVYSLGVVAYRMLTGRLPFTGKTSFEVMHHACIEPVPSMREPGVELPAAMEALVLEMLAKQPEQRPADMGEVRSRLLAIGREARDEVDGVGPTSSPIEVGTGSTSSRLEVETVGGAGAHGVEVDAGTVAPTEVLGRTPQPLEPAAYDLTARVPVPRWRKTEPVEQSPLASEPSGVDRTVVAAAPSGPLVPSPRASEPSGVDRTVVAAAPSGPLEPSPRASGPSGVDRTVVAAAPSGPVEQSPLASGSSGVDRTVVAAAPSGPRVPVVAEASGSSVVSGSPGVMERQWAPGSAASGASGPMGRQWAPQPVVEDAGSVPWTGSVPVADDDEPRPRGTTSILWFALAGAFVMSVTIGVVLSLRGDDEPREVATAATARVEEPSPSAEIAVSSQTDAKIPSVAPEPDAGVPSTPQPEPDEDAPSTPQPGSDAPPPDTPQPEPDAPPVAEERAATKADPPRSKKPRKPAGPPSDAALEKQLARRIKARCAAEMTSGRATVVFDVTPSGEIKRLTAIPKGAAGECAKRQVAGTRFRPRTRETNVEIEVTRAS